MPRRTKSARTRIARRPPRQMGSLTHPPQFISTKQISGRARYLSTGSTESVSRGVLLQHLIMNIDSMTTNRRILSAFRLKSVEIWASTATLGSTVTASVEWFSEYGPSVIHSDTSIGTAEPLHVYTRPPPRSLAGFWCVQGTGESDNLFTITVPANAIVDITYDTVLQDGEALAGVVTTTNNGATGKVYMTYLTGATTTTFVPVSYTSLT